MTGPETAGGSAGRTDVTAAGATAAGPARTGDRTEETPEPVATVVDRGAREWERIDAAYDRGELDDAGWFAAVGAVIEPHYLAGTNPRAQSGHSGDDIRWERARRHILRAVDADGTFLDVGCASGYLMETIAEWAAQDGIELVPFGLEIRPALADLARRRLPSWAGRIHTGNALYWTPPDGRRFDYVRTGLDYVPVSRRGDLLAHLLEHVVGRRLIIGSYNEEKENPAWEAQVGALGYRIAGRDEIPHRDPRVARRVFWVDRDD